VARKEAGEIERESGAGAAVLHAGTAGVDIGAAEVCAVVPPIAAMSR